MEKNFTLTIDKETIDEYNSLMLADYLDYEKNSIPRFSTIKSWTINYGDGYEVDLKICSGNDGEPLWCEAVLFINGSEVECTDVYDSVDGDWMLYDSNTNITFRLHVIPDKCEL